MESTMTTDAAFQSLTEEIEAARGALLTLARSESGRAWHPYELKTRARNGWSSGAMGLALDSLLADGQLVAADGLLVTAVPE
jgi:hypothetical protein